MRFFLLDHGSQGSTIEHRNDVTTMRHLHGRCIGVAIHYNHFNAEPLQLDHHFLAQFATAAQQHAGSGFS